MLSYSVSVYVSQHPFIIPILQSHLGNFLIHYFTSAETVLSKNHTSPTVFEQRFLVLKSSYSGYTSIYTDVSSRSNSVVYAFSCRNRPQSFKLHSFCTVYTAEKYAIFKALSYMELAPEKKFVFCSDFFSGLQSLTLLFSTDALSM